MDNSAKKWMIRGGAFLVLFGFFIPSMAVSCSAYGVTEKSSFSMATAASELGQSILYLVLIGVLVTLIFSFLLPQTPQQRFIYVAGEAAGLALGVFGIFVSFASMYSQIQEMGLNFEIEFGFLALALGYGVAGIGVLLDFFAPPQRFGASRAKFSEFEPTHVPYPPPPMFSPPSGGGARLELVRGNAPRRVALSAPDFHIGRSQRNHCVINDPQVSREHIRLREAQGAWFIQDQNSSSGTYVNGARVQAQRLKDGDEIRIGETVFLFRE